MGIGQISKSFLGISAVIASLLSTAACTRKEAVKSQLSLSVPSSMSSRKVGSQAFDQLKHVIINVTGSGISNPIVFTWDAEEVGMASGAIPTAPSSFTLTVPQGDNRLIQVLAVYGDSTAAGSGSMQFFYGDASKGLAASTESVIVVLSSLGAGAQITSGEVIGRYFKGTNTGPTGRVDILYTPPGKPPMIVDRDMIVSGWFHLFMLGGVSLSYRLPDGSLLWNGPVDINSPVFSASTTTLRASIPLHQRQEFNGGGTPVWVSEDPEVYVYGFFGDASAVAGKAVCDLAGTGSFSSLATGADSNTLLIRENTAGPANLFNGALTGVYVQGGVALGTPPCDDSTVVAANRYSGVLAYSDSLIDGQGKDQVAGFRVPFVSDPYLDEFIIVTENAFGGMNISGTLLPGTEAVIDGFVAFKKPMLERPHMSAAPCGALANGSLGFVRAGTGTIIGSDLSMDVELTAAEAASGTLVALCPSKAGQILEMGVWIAPYQFMGFSRGGSSTATQLAVITFGNKVANGICTPILIDGRDAQNNTAMLTSPISLSFATDNGDTGIYTDSYCGTAAPVPYTLTSGGQVLYLKRSTTGSAAARILTLTSSFPTVTQSLSFMDPVGTPVVYAMSPPTIHAYQCNRVVYVSMLENGTDLMVGDFPGYYNLTLPSAPGIVYYYSGMGSPCSTPGGGYVSLSATNHIGFVDYIYNGSGTTLNLNATGATGSPTYTGTYTGASAISVIQPGPATTMKLVMSDIFGAESCQPVSVQVMDAMGNPAPVSAAVNLSFTFNGSATPPAFGGFYADSTCTSVPGGPPSIAAATTQSSQYYFRWPSSGMLTIGASASPAGLLFQPFNTVVGPVAVGSLIVYPAVGVTYTHPNIYVGYAPPVTENQNFALKIEARSPLGSLITSFNDTNLGPGGINLQPAYAPPATLTCGAVTWTSGVGDLTCSYANNGVNFSTFFLYFMTGSYSGPYPIYYPPSDPANGGYEGHMRVVHSSQPGFSYFYSRSYSYSSGQCQPFMFARGVYTGNPGFLSWPVSAAYTAANLTSTSGVTSFHSDATCSTTITQASLATGESATIIYALLNGASISGLMADFNQPFDPTSSSPATALSAAPASFSQYQISMSPYQYYKICSPMMIVRTDGNGAAVPAASTDTVTLSSTFPSTFWADATCSTSVGSSVSFSSGQSAKLVYVRPEVTNFAAGSVTATNGSQTGSVSGMTVSP